MRIWTFLLLGLWLALAVGAETGADPGTLELDKQLFELCNRERARENLPPYKPVERLAHCAREHSREMAELKYFSHTSPTEGRKTKRDRVTAVGLEPRLIAENIYMARGCKPQDAVAKAMAAWMKSPGHRANILNPEYTQLGVGMWVSGDEIHITQVFSTDTQ